MTRLITILLLAAMLPIMASGSMPPPNPPVQLMVMMTQAGMLQDTTNLTAPWRDIVYLDATNGLNVTVGTGTPTYFFRRRPDPVPVTLQWTASPDTNVIGYKIYYGPASHDYRQSVFVGNVTTATLQCVPTPLIVLTATTIGPNGMESDFCPEEVFTPVETKIIRIN